MKNTYKFLTECEDLILHQLKHGKSILNYYFFLQWKLKWFGILDVPLCDVYKAVRDKVEKEHPELANKMTTTLGFVGIDMCRFLLSTISNV